MKISKTKRNQLLLIFLCTVAVLTLMWLELIQPRYRVLAQVDKRQKAAETKLDGIQNAIKHSQAVTAELDHVTQTLSHAESDLATGDLYSWTYNTIRRFKAPYRVNIPDIGHPDVETMDLLPSFPFKQVKFTVTGTAYYQDFGQFIADFENTFPHIRVVNLQLQPAQASSGDEELSFKMDIIALVKPTSL